MIYNKRIVVGLVEKITINGGKKRKTLIAKIDTGATKSSMDTKLAEEMKLGPVIKNRLIKSAHGNKVRPVIEGEIEIADKKIKSEFTLADREHMKYGVLIGQNILKQGFLVDPLKDGQ